VYKNQLGEWLMPLGSKNQYFSFSLLPILLRLTLNIDFYCGQRIKFSLSLLHTQIALLKYINKKHLLVNRQ
jgi:hypothetical protein